MLETFDFERFILLYRETLRGRYTLFYFPLLLKGLITFGSFLK